MPSATGTRLAFLLRVYETLTYNQGLNTGTEANAS